MLQDMARGWDHPEYRDPSVWNSHDPDQLSELTLRSLISDHVSVSQDMERRCLEARKSLYRKELRCQSGGG